MNFVEPIRSRNHIAQIKNVLKGQERYRDFLLFTVGVNSALRVSDLLQLRIGDFVDENGEIRQRFSLREQKRGKRHEVVINQSIREALELYRKAYQKFYFRPKIIASLIWHTRSKAQARTIFNGIKRLMMRPITKLDIRKPQTEEEMAEMAGATSSKG